MPAHAALSGAVAAVADGVAALPGVREWAGAHELIVTEACRPELVACQLRVLAPVHVGKGDIPSG